MSRGLQGIDHVVPRNMCSKSHFQGRVAISAKSGGRVPSVCQWRTQFLIWKAISARAKKQSCTVAAKWKYEREGAEVTGVCKAIFF